LLLSQIEISLWKNKGASPPSPPPTCGPQHVARDIEETRLGGFSCNDSKCVLHFRILQSCDPLHCISHILPSFCSELRNVLTLFPDEIYLDSRIIVCGRAGGPSFFRVDSNTRMWWILAPGRHMLAGLKGGLFLAARDLEIFRVPE
jgi:hypothetical protein